MAPCELSLKDELLVGEKTRSEPHTRCNLESPETFDELTNLVKSELHRLPDFDIGQVCQVYDHGGLVLKHGKGLGARMRW